MSDTTDKIESSRTELNKVINAGNNLLKFVDTHCSCRRDWVCHKCEAVNAWKIISSASYE